MFNKAVHIISVVTLLALSAFCRASTNDPNDSLALQIYLPREIIVKGDCLTLGQLALLRGSDHLVTKANGTLLGRISIPGQEVVIDRPTVLSRLASNGVPASVVAFVGAEKVMVKQQQQIIKGTDLVARASAFLKDNPSAVSACQFEPILVPQDFIAPESSKSIELRPRLVNGSTGNQAKVQIIALQDGKQIGSREVTFRLKYSCRTAVTLVDIPAGSVINSENIKIVNTLSNHPEPADWKPPFGLITKRNLPANTVLSANMVAPAGRPLVVERNQNVVIRIEKPGLLITALGKTMENGRAGEYIKVRNVDSQRIILAKVNEDGTVEPVL
jgi:flagella basal body P-ring formation protein FlgA